MITLSTDRNTCGGIAIGKAILLERQELLPASRQLSPNEIGEEILTYEHALELAAWQMKKLAEDTDIFNCHLAMLQDTAWKEQVLDKIRMGKNAEQALSEVAENYTRIIGSTEDRYLRERSNDVKDVRDRIMRILKRMEEPAVTQVNEEVILIAENLVPSDTSAMNFHYVKGFITELGTAASHVSIIAKNKKVPAFTGVSGILKLVKNGDIVILDAEEGMILINPDQSALERYMTKINDRDKADMEPDSPGPYPCVTLDGKSFELHANAGSIEEVSQAVHCQAGGIGLLRTEFLFMNSRDFPTEEEQFEWYKQAAMACPGGVIIRTLDIGGDKELSYFPIDKEANPYLGWRGIRILLSLITVYKTQLRAILRASSYGNLKIMLPMVISVEELLKAKEILAECKQELQREGISYQDEIELGIMVETPAAVINIEEFAKLSDFFSIGTNDLTQYILAVDRGNCRISEYYNSFHPAVLKSIHRIIMAGHSCNKKVAMCGEFAADQRAVKLLVGMGLDTFSVNGKDIASVREVIRGIRYEDAAGLADKVLKAKQTKEVMEVLGDE